MTTVITGASGFVGRHLTERITDAIPITRRDADLAQGLPALPPAETVIHCAAALDDAAVMDDVNVQGTRRLIEWAVDAGVRRFVFLSTGGVELPGRYAETKREAEEIVAAAAGAMVVQIVRLFFPYGPGQHAPRLIPRLIETVREGRPVNIDLRGGPFLSVTYITDVIDGVVRIAALGDSHRVDLGGPPIAMRQIALQIGMVVGREPLFETREEPSTDLIADAAALFALTGFRPMINFAEGVRACV
jgi:nucleoside-diphosphate-sugar epimerase